MRRLFAAALAAAAIVACGSTPAQEPVVATPKVKDVETYVRIYGGLSGAYRVILEETDCDELQELFYTATDNSSTGFQTAIIDRSADLGCPEPRFTRP